MPVKMINLADTGAGKTGALASLCAAGYNVRVLDLDNGMESLVNVLTDSKSQYPKEAIGRLRWRTLTEPMRIIGGQIQPKAATVWNLATAMLEAWKGDSAASASGQVIPTTDGLGNIGNWGEKDVLVIDTLSTLGTAAMNFNLMMNGDLGKRRSSMEAMRDVGAAQGQLDKLLQLLFDSTVRCHVIVNTHVVFAKEDGTAAEPGYTGMIYAFPAAIGKALSPKMGKYFNHMLMTRRVGTDQRIYTRGMANVGLKSGAPLRVKESYPVKTGLADYFRDVIGQADLQPAPVEAAK